MNYSVPDYGKKVSAVLKATQHLITMDVVQVKEVPGAEVLDLARRSADLVMGLTAVLDGCRSIRYKKGVRKVQNFPLKLGF